MPRFGLTIDVWPRDLPFSLLGVAVAGYAHWTGVPAEVADPVALLIVLDIRIRRSRRRI
ncbi:hypothetical protein ACIRP7_02855 [Streptomyces sp. NPDC102270]|uniref:hypothetical protein n=1 Tax=Streptomyces sp. NPDC102270 TaxID=3366150 RepID=UPI00381636CB